MNSHNTVESIVIHEKKLVAELTGVEVNEIDVNNVGETSRVYIVGKGKFVIKFPRTKDVKKEYKQEKVVLKLLKDAKTDVQIPRLRWTDPNNDYLGYKGIVGQAFDQVKLPEDKLGDIGTCIGQFLKQLHSINMPGARAISIEDEVKDLHDKYKRISNIDKYFGPDELSKLQKAVFGQIPSELVSLGISYALCHGDLGYWNLILKDDGTVGVIDFGDIGLWDNSKDFIGLEDKEILEEALNVYGDSPILRQKIAIRQKILAILDLRYFIDAQNKSGIEKTIAKIKTAL